MPMLLLFAVVFTDGVFITHQGVNIHTAGRAIVHNDSVPQGNNSGDCVYKGQFMCRYDNCCSLGTGLFEQFKEGLFAARIKTNKWLVHNQ